MLIRAPVAVVEKLRLRLKLENRTSQPAAFRQRQLGKRCNDFRGAHLNILPEKEFKLKPNCFNDNDVPAMKASQQPPSEAARARAVFIPPLL